jgi:hypothetical protein
MSSPNARARRHGWGTPGTCSSPRMNKQAPKYYAPPADAFPVTSGGTTAMAMVGQTPKGRVAQPPLVRQLSFANLLAVPAGTSVSSLSQSTKTSSRGKRDGPTITNPYHAKKTRSEPSLKFHSGESNNYSPSNVEDDKELDFVPVTNQAVNNIMEGKGTWEEDAMTAMHRKVSYMKAYPVANPHELFAKPQSKSASMKTCCPKTEVNYIKNVIQHWGKGIKIRDMEDGEEKNRLLSFRKRNKVGNKYIHQYCLEEVWAPGDDEPRQVLRRLEAKKGALNKTLQEGRIVPRRKFLMQSTSGINIVVTLVRRELGNTAEPSIGMSLSMSSTTA